jgi:hypothetical protein
MKMSGGRAAGGASLESMSSATSPVEPNAVVWCSAGRCRSAQRRISGGGRGRKCALMRSSSDAERGSASGVANAGSGAVAPGIVWVVVVVVAIARGEGWCRLLQSRRREVRVEIYAARRRALRNAGSGFESRHSLRKRPQDPDEIDEKAEFGEERRDDDVPQRRALTCSWPSTRSASAGANACDNDPSSRTLSFMLKHR